jgi:hypothetical protein
MKRFAVALCGALLIGLAGQPAVAQPGGWGLDARIVEVQRAIDRGVADGALDRPQYEHVEGILQDIRHKRDEILRARGALEPAQTQSFEVQLDTLVNEIRWARNEWRRPW